MPKIRFNHVFFALMALAFVCAFFVSGRRTGMVREVFQRPFTLLSEPVHRWAGKVEHRMEDERLVKEDPRSAAEVLRENDALRVAVVNLGAQLEALRRLNAERDLVGPARELSVPATVVAADSGGRDSISLSLTSGQGAREGLVVVYPGGVAGRVVSAGVSGSQVRLVTDAGSRVMCTFGRYRQNGERLEFLRVPLGQQIVEGRGGGNMVVTNVTEKQVREADVRVGDWAVVADPEWPMNLQGYRVGQVKEIKAAKAALFVEIWLKPEVNLMGLHEVMVMTR